MTIKLGILICATALIFCQSCRMLDVLAGSESAGTVEALWADVPPVDGAKKADLAIPLVSRLIIRTFTQGKVNFIAYTTPRSAAEIQSIYANDRMRAAGWTPSNGCVADAESGPSQGAVCVFIREKDSKENGLAIVVAEDPEKKETHIFYARFEIESEKKDPNSEAGRRARQAN